LKKWIWLVLLLFCGACESAVDISNRKNGIQAEPSVYTNDYAEPEHGTVPEGALDTVQPMAYTGEPGNETSEADLLDDTDGEPDGEPCEGNGEAPCYEPEEPWDGIFRNPAFDVSLPMVALTFDDGPGGETAGLLDILERHGARATFCVIGRYLDEWADTVKRAADMGCEIIGHSWNHSDFTHLSAQEIQKQINNTHNKIETLVGEMPMVYRPPFGAVNTRVKAASKEAGFAILRWSVDPRDWENRCADHVYNAIMKHVKDGSVVICHDTHPTTVKAMERVIPRLLEDGYQLVTVSELLGHWEGKLEPGVVYFGNR
jgi:peptidoglycan/xylan/chitin deacetylase (PgdA/CDA1 family)